MTSFQLWHIISWEYIVSRDCLHKLLHAYLTQAGIDKRSDSRVGKRQVYRLQNEGQGSKYIIIDTTPFAWSSALVANKFGQYRCKWVIIQTDEMICNNIVTG